ncbi:MAG: pentapeptide repeat-containing protein [Nostocaceae cyanobacterium]|nr:pentapeptide repeat-containing protein [Nostocaceae cyanobacterium]
MSANKTDDCWKWLISISVVFNVSCAVVLLSVSQIEGISKQEKIANRNRALTTTATFFLGLAVMMNAYYAAKRAIAMGKSAEVAQKNLELEVQKAHIAEERLIAERLRGAISQLGDKNPITRAGAIYTLEQVARDSAESHWTTMEILTAFVREYTATQSVVSLHLEELARLPVDIQAALTVIGRRDTNKDPQNQKLDLRHVDIRKADLRQANLKGLDLRASNLSGADLYACQLEEADLEQSKLAGANLQQANLQYCNLRGADLCAANLNQAQVRGANAQSANLCGAILRQANMNDANLYKASLQGANLSKANLSGAKLFLVNLQGANLSKANLQGTGLIGANLQHGNLNGANLQRANLNAAKLQQAELLFANLSDASLAEANLSGANLMGSNLQRANLYEANLCETNLIAANFCGANLDDVQLEGAILKGAKNLQPQQIKTALGNHTTSLPDYMQIPIHWQKLGNW